jgi:hypothetical protein
LVGNLDGISARQGTDDGHDTGLIAGLRSLPDRQPRKQIDNRDAID